MSINFDHQISFHTLL